MTFTPTRETGRPAGVTNGCVRVACRGADTSGVAGVRGAARAPATSAKAAATSRAAGTPMEPAIARRPGTTSQRTSAARCPSSCVRTVWTDEFAAPGRSTWSRTRSEGGSREPSRRRLARRVAGRPQGPARQGEGPHPPPGRPERRAPPAPDGEDREGLPLRGPRRRGDAPRPVRGPPPAHDRPLHVRPEVGGRLPELLRRRGRGRARPARAPARPRHDARVRVPGAAPEDRALQG